MTTVCARAAGSHRASGFVPVADYGLLADCHSAALVDREGSTDWLCLPRYDSDAIFARLLDPNAGHCSIRPADDFSAERRYVPGSLVIETSGSGRERQPVDFHELCSVAFTELVTIMPNDQHDVLKLKISTGAR
jgi:GH15 family glucan-1,4-alpha-glucosidase